MVERWAEGHPQGKGKGKEVQRLYDEYREALERPSTYDIQIDLDVPRTISGHVMFRTRYGHGYVSLPSIHYLQPYHYYLQIFLDIFLTFLTP